MSDMHPTPQPPAQSAGPSAAAAGAPGAKASVWSLVLGILGMFMCVPAAVAAVILGIIALGKPGNPRRGMGLAGLILGGVGLILIPVVALLVGILMPSLGRAREIAQMSMCGANMNGVGMGVIMYQAEHEDAPPPDLQTMIDMGSISKELLTCPSAKGKHPQPHYFYFPPSGSGVPGTTFIMCDLKGNHPRDGRNVLTYGASVQKFRTEALFQQALARPENAAFAAALKKADRP